MNIRVVGAGAVGCLLGGLALEGGHEVSFSGSPEAARQLSTRGLRLILPDRWVRMDRIRTDSGSSGRWKPDLTIVALKRHQLKEHRSFSGGKTGDAFLFLNCDPLDIGDQAPAGIPSLPGYTLLTAVMLEPGRVELASRRSWIILPKHPLLREAAQAWKAGGIEAHEADPVEEYAHSFFLWQLLFLPIAMCHSTYSHFLADASGRQIAAEVLEEGLATFARLGRALKKLPHMDPQELIKRIRKRPEELDAGALEPDRGYNSMLQSILRGKKTEVRELNERLVKMAAEAGIEARWNWRLVQKLSRVVQVGFYHSPAELCKALE